VLAHAHTSLAALESRFEGGALYDDPLEGPLATPHPPRRHGADARSSGDFADAREPSPRPLPAEESEVLPRALLERVVPPSVALEERVALLLEVTSRGKTRALRTLWPIAPSIDAPRRSLHPPPPL